MKPQMDPAKAEAWLKILTDPRFLKMLETAKETREEIAYRILTGCRPQRQQGSE